MTPKPDLWHTPRPGPDYWDWRCLTCGEPVRHHPGLLARLLRRIGLHRSDCSGNPQTPAPAPIRCERCRKELR